MLFLSREELQQAIGSNAVVLAVSNKGWWGRYFTLAEVLGGVEVTRRFGAGAGGALVVILAEVLRGGRWNLLILQLLQWTVVVVVGLELSMRLWLAWYARRSHQLVAALQGLLSAMNKYNQAYGDSLTLVKRAELASRGYRLGGGLLPPIGRLEASSGEDGATERQLRCLPLRRKLRALNNQILELSSMAPEEREKREVSSEENENLVEGEDDKAPSLLLTALAKHRSRSTFLLENAVRTRLVRDVERACSSSVSCNLLSTLVSQRLEAQRLIEALSKWTGDLQTWNSTKNPVALLALDSNIQPPKRQQALLDPVNPRLNNIASQLHDLRSISETLTALVIASQQDLLTDAALQQLSSSRDTMQSMVQQLQKTWSEYNTALNVLEGKVSRQDADAGEEGEREESTPVETPVPDPAREEPNCTVVFTGTSTGDDGFDLQALLKQQEVADAAAGPTPRFVRELQDVLAHREAHTRPILTKQVDQDPPALLTPVPDLPPPPAADVMFALPRAPPRGRPRRQPAGSAASLTDSEPLSLGSANTDKNFNGAFNLELEALLQRVQPSVRQDVIECLSDSGEESATG